MHLNIGEIYAGKYRIIRQLGAGAMGAVYEAENARIRRRVAIKALHPHVAQKSDTVKRFEREAQAAGRIGSQHIVEVLDLGELPDGTRYMVMEFLEGTPLDQRIKQRGRLTPEEAAPLLVQLLSGLGAAHDAQIIHRDLKPANVFLSNARGGDFVKIVDFGVSKFNALSDEMSMTSTGAVLGTPYYMSPEQAKGSREIDHRSDLYAAGVILYECITGQVPFSAETFNELLFRIVLEQPPPIETFVPNLDPSFIAIVRKSMARDPAERFQTAREFADTLSQWIAGARPLTANGTLMMDAAPSIPIGDGGTLMMPNRPPGHGLPHASQPPPPPAAGVPGYGVPSNGQMLQPTPVSFGAPGALGSTVDRAAPPKQSSAVLAVLLGVLGLLVVGTGVLLAVRFGSDKPSTASAATPSASVPVVGASASAPSPEASQAAPSGTVIDMDAPPGSASAPVASAPRVAGPAPLPGPLPGKAAPGPKANNGPSPSKGPKPPAGKGRTVSTEL